MKVILISFFLFFYGCVEKKKDIFDVIIDNYQENNNIKKLDLHIKRYKNSYYLITQETKEIPHGLYYCYLYRKVLFTITFENISKNELFKNYSFVKKTNNKIETQIEDIYDDWNEEYIIFEYVDGTIIKKVVFTNKYEYVEELNIKID